ncbi:MAG: type IV toxin-antitoxin system AbiEi family antitoxin [Dehalococcoidia bacterium]
MRELEVTDRIRERIGSLLNDIPFLELRKPIAQMSLEGVCPDLLLEVMVRKRPSKIVVEMKSVGEPRQVRYAIQQLREYLARIENAYGVVAAPYISNDTARLCKENGVGYMDLAGNCFLNFDQVYIEQTNYPNPNVEKRRLRSLFTPRSSRVLRVMLVNPRRSWQVQELAREANVSIGLASRIKERLLDLEYAREEKRNILLNRPGELLDKWADNYSFRRNRLYDYFGFGEPKEIERRLAGYCQEREIPYALTLFSGAALVAPFARYTRGFAYVGKGIRELAESVELKEVSSGPNFSILEPYDEGVFYGSRIIEGLEVACDVQLYLDLVGYKGRGEESARFLLEQRIKPQW